MSFCAIESDRSYLATMIGLAWETVGHHCLIFKDFAQLTRILRAIRVEKIVLDVGRPGLNVLDWLETMAPSWPDLPSRTLLVAESELTPGDVARIRKLGAEFVSRPSSLAEAKLVVMERLRNARSERTGRALHVLKEEVFARTRQSRPSGSVLRRRWNPGGSGSQ